MLCFLNPHNISTFPQLKVSRTILIIRQCFTNLNDLDQKSQGMVFNIYGTRYFLIMWIYGNNEH